MLDSQYTGKASWVCVYFGVGVSYLTLYIIFRFRFRGRKSIMMLLNEFLICLQHCLQFSLLKVLDLFCSYPYLPLRHAAPHTESFNRQIQSLRCLYKLKTSSAFTYAGWTGGFNLCSSLDVLGAVWMVINRPITELWLAGARPDLLTLKIAEAILLAC